VNLLLDAALGYAARGIPVYPVHWPRPTPGATTLGCSCPRGPACDRPAKHPLVRHGIHDATTNPGQLERWWHRWPQANLGLATGIIFDALDIDGPAGLAALHKLAQTVGLRLPGPLVATGAVAGTTGFAPPASATGPPAASPTSTGAASAAARSPHPAATPPVAPIAGCATLTGHRCRRSRPHSARC
jgi:Bifunctional DNA primase/polymerase, N-terminal